MTFQALWAIASATGLQPPLDGTMLRKGVLLASVMQLLTMPATLFQARKALPKIAGYIVPMSCCGMLSVYFGALLLLSTDTDALRLTAGLFFGCLSLVQISIAAWSALLARARVASAMAVPNASLLGAPPAANLCVSDATRDFCGQATVACRRSGQKSVKHFAEAVASVTPSITPVEVLHAANGAAVDASESHYSDDIEDAGIYERTSLNQTAIPASAPDGSSAPTQSRTWVQWKAHVLPHVSERMSPGPMLALLCGASMMSGLFAGLLGTCGPPFMTAYAFLRLDKEILLGFSAVPAGFVFFRIILYTGSFSTNSSPVYLSVLVAAGTGVVAGASFRRYINSEALVRVLHALVFLSSALMLGVTTNAAITEAYGVVLLVGSALVVTGLLWPDCVLRLARSFCDSDNSLP